MNKMKIITILGTRPEIIRLSRVIHELDLKTNHKIIHTGQNYDYELNEIFFKELGIRKPDFFLNAAGQSSCETVAKVIMETEKVLLAEKPDAFLVLGDTNSSLGVYAAKRLKIPTFHMEAGNRSYDQRIPEEINRKIIDHISDINLVYSDLARQSLIREGLPLNQIIKTGSPMREVLSFYESKIKDSSVLTNLGLKPETYFVVSAHREENVNNPKNFEKLITTINTIAEKYDQPIIFSTHPRTNKIITDSQVHLHSQIKILKPLGFLDYIKLQQNARCVLSDSGTISEESSILNFPALNLREAHERPETMDEAAVVMSGLETTHVLRCLEAVLDQPRGDKKDFDLTKDYTPTNVSKKVVRIILSYTDFINKKIWFK
ncbi:MAG: UDP-N-acetylglucosamine 2-epimerase (non-hydrolyzing) [Candidatus Vogelbacteria bacterium]|nr:UDP-N-acetylglucosamine 2-epimerase (non-hydrolyzing) [Candidatus Vogelbacteria bacterium]